MIQIIIMISMLIGVGFLQIIIKNKLTAMSRFNNTTLPQHHDIKKIYCAYHPVQFLTNFCCDPQCLMPLCPNCIVQHTEQHFLQSNKPCYVNINDAIQDTKQKCYQHIVIFEELNRSNDKIFDYLMGLKESIHNQLLQDKQFLFQMIDEMFDNYQDKLYGQTVAKYKELQVYDKNETQNISSFIDEQIQTLHNQISMLKGENCLAGLITYYANDGKVYQDSIRQISQHIQRHKVAGKICITSNQESLVKALEQFCENNLTIQFLKETNKEKQQQQRLKQSKMVKEGKILQTRNSKINHFKQGQYISKENQIDNSNQYRNNQKKMDEYYKIDTNEIKLNKSPNSSINRHSLNSHKQSIFRHQ